MRRVGYSTKVCAHTVFYIGTDRYGVNDASIDRRMMHEGGAAMEKEYEEQRIWNSPNIVTLCMDSYNKERQDGRLYHQYTDQPVRFASLLTAIEQMDTFYDDIQFPFASTESRSFFVDRRAREAALRRSRRIPELPEYKRKDMRKMATFDDVIENRGTDATFIIRVQHRQHSSWQGEVIWVDGQKKEYFRSALELVKLIDGALGDSDGN